jgi:hypothetical protein
MKNKIKVFGLVALIAVFAFSMAACFGQGGGKTINSAEELKTYLDSQPANSSDKPIKVTMNANEQMIGNIAEVIRSTDRYVSLTLSGNGLTTIPDFAFYDREAKKGCDMLVSVTMPNSVTEIGMSAFFNCTNLKGVTIPDSVIKIGAWAFGLCGNLTNVTIGNGVTKIGRCAFIGCTSLTSVIIPDNVTEIGSEAFDNCTGLASVIIGHGVIEIGEMVFRNCKSLTSVTIPNSVTEIGYNAFRDCTGLKNIIIGNGVTEIRQGAFWGCERLTTVSIGNGLEYGEIDGSTFYSSSLTAINVAAGNTAYSSVDGILYDKNKTELILYPAGKTASSFTIPDSVTEIGNRAFSGCTNLTSVTLPNSVTEIGNRAFSGCTSLTSITLPDSVTEIGEGTFNVDKDRTNLTSITIGADVELFETYVVFTLDGPMDFDASFGSGFESFYINGGKRAGTYTRPNNESKTWTSPNVFRENFSRVLELNIKRMNGPDVEALQKRLLYLGFSGVGEADGYYGPKTEETIKTIQKFAGFDENGKVDRKLWDFIFGDDNFNIQ